MKQRWYDKDPTVSLAISLLKNTNEETKRLCAEEIIKEVEEKGIKLPTGLISRINSTFQRWYDEDSSLSKAMEYLRLSPPELRKGIAIEIIELLERAETI